METRALSFYILKGVSEFVDELKIKTSKWSPVLEKLIRHIIKKKLCIGSNIKINSFELFALDGKLHVHVDLDGEVNEDALISKILTKLV